MTCQVGLFYSKCGIVSDGRGAVVFRFRTALLPPFSVQLTRKNPKNLYPFILLFEPNRSDSINFGSNPATSIADENGKSSVFREA